MEEQLSATDQIRVGNEKLDSSGSGLAYLLKVLVLGVLTVLVTGAYLLYEPLRENGLLSRSSAQIAFMSDRDGNWEVFLIDRDGANLQNLTNDPSDDGLPIHSPGQDNLAFASDRGGSGLDLFLVGLDGSDMMNLTQTPDVNELPIAWSPNGERLVYFSDQNGPTEIFLSQTTSEGLLNLSERDRAQSFDDWSPKADRFVLTASTDAGILLLVTDRSGERPQALTDGSFPAGGGQWSPDGQKIAFMAIAPGSSAIDVHIVDAAGGESVNLTQSSSSDRFPRWSPDGSRIAFVSDRDGNSEIYAMAADGSNLTNLTNNPADESIQGDFAWSPDGTQILFVTNRDGNVEVYVMDADGTNPLNLTNSPGTDFSGIWVE